MSTQAEWSDAHQRLRAQLGAWIRASLDRQRDVPYHGVHDEGSFTFSWDAYCFLTHDEPVRAFLTSLRDGFDAWGRENLHHGYYPEGEVHHGTEFFTHFLARFRTLDPGDPVAVRLLDDVAHHTGNWEPGVPDWYDWSEHRFVSWRIGSKRVPTTPPDDHEEPDSVRPAMIALAAYAATGEERYLDFCVDYGDKWARALVEEPLPRVAFWPSGEAAYDDTIRAQAEGDVALRMELVAASGMIDYLLDLIALTDSDLYRRALKRIVPALVDTVADPRNATSAAHLAKYRRVTGDTGFDDQIVRRLGRPCEDGGELRILDVRDAPEKRRKELIFNERIGHRFDQVRWGRADASGRACEVTEPSPAAWSLAYQITGDTSYAARAMDQAAGRLRLAAASLRDGRDHGCAGRSAGAVASGHGRADRYGDVNTVFGPLALGSLRLFSAEQPLVIYETGLPEQITTLVRFGPTPSVAWRNSGDDAARFAWRDGSKGAAGSQQVVALAPGEMREAKLVAPMPAFAPPTNS